jgi:hypothetical protein
MKNIHILPTDKPSRLFIIDGKLYNYHKPQQGDGVNEINQHIYITNSEEIKEGDYVYSIKQGYNIQKVPKGLVKSYQEVEHYKKIILTTDQDLINDGIQPIDDEFLEWFVKNPSCERVEVADLWREGNPSAHDSYQLVIPQEEPKQETLEEAAEKEFPLVDTEWCRTGAAEEENLHLLGHRKSFIKGAKYQAERMYSEEEVISLLNDFAQHLIFNKNSSLNIIEWFEQFKKK